MQYYRQGDVAIIPVDDPDAATRSTLTPIERDGGRVVLQYGEVTGHAHAVSEADVDLYEPGIASDLAERFLRVGQRGAVVVHEEHGPIALAPGWYEVRRQREYTPEEIRLVAD